MEIPWWMDTWTASAHSSAAAAAAAAERCCCCLGQTQLYLLHSLQYHRQVHNPLMFVMVLSHMEIVRYFFARDEQWTHEPWSMALFGFGLCYVLPRTSMSYVLCIMCCGGAWCVVRGGPFPCASSPAQLWPLSNLPGRVFDGVSCTRHT